MPNQSSGPAPDDAVLLERFARGDLAAFESLYARCGRGLYGYALGVCGSEQVAADATQDTWLALIQQAAKFAAARNVRAYLYRAVRNRAIELVRRRGPQPAQRAVLVKSAADDAQGRENAARLNEALYELPEQQREVVLLRIYESMTFPQIAEVVGEGVKTVESRHRLAIEKLKGLLDGVEP